MESFGERLKELRNNKGLKAEELAEIIGVKRRVIFLYENNETKPSYDVLIALADYFEVSIDYLLGRTGELRNAFYHRKI